MKVRTLTPDEAESEFGLRDEFPINWGVIVNGRIVACFSAEPESYEPLILNVHANVRRHTLRPAETVTIARSFSEQLLAQGAAQLLCRIPLSNRAALRMAKAAGYQPDHTEDSDQVLIYSRKYSDG